MTGVGIVGKDTPSPEHLKWSWRKTGQSRSICGFTASERLSWFLWSRKHTVKGNGHATIAELNHLRGLRAKDPQWRLMNWILDVWVGAFLPLGIQDLRAGKKLKRIPRSVHAPGDGSCRPSTKFIETSVLEARLASSVCSARPLPPPRFFSIASLTLSSQSSLVTSPCDHTCK